MQDFQTSIFDGICGDMNCVSASDVAVIPCQTKEVEQNFYYQRVVCHDIPAITSAYDVFLVGLRGAEVEHYGAFS